MEFGLSGVARCVSYTTTVCKHTTHNILEFHRIVEKKLWIKKNTDYDFNCGISSETRSFMPDTLLANCKTFSFLFFPSSFELWPPLFSLPLAPQWREQESWSSHSERQAPKLLFNHFQIVLLEGRGSCVSAPTSSAALIEPSQSSVTVKDRGNGCILDWGYSFIQQLHLPSVYRSVHRRRKDGCICGAEFQLFIDMAFLLKPHMNLMLYFLTWICSYQMCKGHLNYSSL